MINGDHRPAMRTMVGACAAAASLAAGLALAAPAGARTTPRPVNGRHVLTVVGNARANAITVGRDAAGVITVNDHAVRIHGARATVANVRSIVVFGGAGDDRILIDETNGPMPAARIFGGSGNDALFGGSGADRLFGQAGNDTLTGGAGTDRLYGGTGADQLIWNPGDGSDLDEGGRGADAVIVNGGGVGERFTAAAEGARVRFDRVDPLPFTLDIGTSEHLLVNANGGDDSFTASGDLASLIGLTVNGGAGNDRIVGGNGDDVLTGGDGDDFVDGKQGSDTAVLGAGDDTFQWDAGEGSDTVDGGAGQDALVFNGADAAEKFELSANGAGARLVRDVGRVTMDLTGVERVDTNALGGADQVTVDDLSGTDVTEANVNLAGTSDSSAGDRAGDSVVVNGTDEADSIKVTGAQPAGVTISGLHPVVQVTGTDGAGDALRVNALGGDDTVDARGLSAGVVSLTLDGGSGTNVITQ
jgi:RTX calcium-binding nonapeptide repeat (4 copies)